MSRWTIQEEDESSSAVCVGSEPVFWFDPERYQHVAEYVVMLVEGGCEHEWVPISRCEKCGRVSDSRV